MGAVQFWLSNGTQRIQLPVNPETLRIASPFGFEDVTVAQLGEVTIIGDVMLRDYSFESFFPRDYNVSFCEYTNIPRPWDVYNRIERWKRERKPIRFIVTGTPINLDVTIRDFECEPERAGSPGDIYFSMVLKEYKPASFTKVVPTASGSVKSASTSRPTSATSKSQTYVVKSGDTLTKIAQRFYKDGSKYSTIYNANKAVIGKNPNEIKPGMKLVIP